jgi:hypothetical protein
LGANLETDIPDADLCGLESIREPPPGLRERR